MNRKLALPVFSQNLDRAGLVKTAKRLKELKCDIVFLADSPMTCNKEERKKTLDMLKEQIGFFKSEGFSVGVWHWSFMMKGENPFKKITNSHGESNPAFVCPGDPEFLEFVYEYNRDIAKLNPDYILFDDDYRFFHLGGGVSCFCELHMKAANEILGEDLTRDELAEKALKGDSNPYRKAWLKAKGESLENFAKTLRRAVDSVNPNIRVGLCACMSTWIGDGTDCIKIAKALAGNTKPFIRFIGAPYWAVNRDFGGNRLQDVIELERMQSAWCENQGIETFNEGDVYPRPRYACPASYLELFDIALIADGKSDGIIKYMLDYYGSADYEKGYTQCHLDNSQLREDIYNLFKDKEAVGVRVFESLEKFDNAKFSEDVVDQSYIENMFFSLAPTFLSMSSIPTHYDDTDGVTLVFGENVRNYPYQKSKSPLILDIFAADFLQNNGIDVGLVSVEGDFSGAEFGCITDFELYDPSIDEYAFSSQLRTKSIKIKDGCKEILYYNIGQDKTPAAYTYKNKDGQAFLVFAFDARYSGKDGARNYLLQNALIRGIEEIGGQLPAVCPKNPDLYIITKQKDNRLAVGLFNLFADELLYKDITLAKEIQSVNFINCEGVFDGNTVTINALKAFDVAAFEVLFKD